MNSGLRWPAINSDKRDNFFLLYGRSVKLARLDWEGDPSTSDSFSPYKQGYDLYKCFKFFYVFSKNWPFNMNVTFEIWSVNSSF